MIAGKTLPMHMSFSHPFLKYPSACAVASLQFRGPLLIPLVFASMCLVKTAYLLSINRCWIVRLQSCCKAAWCGIFCAVTSRRSYLRPDLCVNEEFGWSEFAQWSHSQHAYKSARELNIWWTLCSLNMLGFGKGTAAQVQLHGCFFTASSGHCHIYWCCPQSESHIVNRKQNRISHLGLIHFSIAVCLMTNKCVLWQQNLVSLNSCWAVKIWIN